MNVTQWFNTKQNPPVNVGNYDYIYHASEYIFNAYWDGAKFLIKDGNYPEHDGEEVQVRACDEWRGVAE